MILPQNSLVTISTERSAVETDNLFGIFNIGNNFYTLTYYLAVPIAASALVLIEGGHRRSILLFVCAVACAILSILFGRRGPLISGGITWLFVFLFAPVNSGVRRRSVSAFVWISAIVGAISLGWSNTDWGETVIIAFGDRASTTLDDPRIMLFQRGIEALSLSPFGGGLTIFRSIQSESPWAHNAVLAVGLDVGVLGALVFALAIGQIVWRMLARLIKRRQPLDGLEICLVAVVLSNVLLLMQEPFLTERLLVFIWAGVLLSCTRPAATGVADAPTLKRTTAASAVR
jgi:O-antigen ligase